MDNGVKIKYCIAEVSSNKCSSDKQNSLQQPKPEVKRELSLSNKVYISSYTFCGKSRTCISDVYKRSIEYPQTSFKNDVLETKTVSETCRIKFLGFDVQNCYIYKIPVGISEWE